MWIITTKKWDKKERETAIASNEEAFPPINVNTFVVCTNRYSLPPRRAAETSVNTGNN
jgi:hypothetical protein